MLRRLGLRFAVVPSGASEAVEPGTAPAEAVERVARRKGRRVAAAHPEAIILAADTTVILDGRALGKPADEAEAHRMLRQLSGRTHEVFTGIALVHPGSGRLVSAHERTEVTFGALSDVEIAAYVSTGSPLDKAGAYGIQDDLGALLIERIRGDYYNVVGLPLRRLYVMLRDRFPDLLGGPR